MSKSYKGFILFILCIIGSFTGTLAYTHWAKILSSLAFDLFFWAIIISLGLYFAEQAGFKVFLSPENNLVSDMVIPGLIAGLVVAIVPVIAVVLTFKDITLDFFLIMSDLHGVDIILELIFMSVNSVVLFDLFFVSGFAWLLNKFSLTKGISAWLAIALVSLASSALTISFVPMGVPMSENSNQLFTILAFSNFILQAGAMGWLYWRYSLVTAIFATAAYGGVFYLFHQLLPCIV